MITSDEISGALNEPISEGNERNELRQEERRKESFLYYCLIFGRKFNVFDLFYFVFESNFRVQAPDGLIFGGAI